MRKCEPPPCDDGNSSPPSSAMRRWVGRLLALSLAWSRVCGCGRALAADVAASACLCARSLPAPQPSHRRRCR
eukprot:scaffold1284_cov353-Prasinococcus_capsulatus_cf.AAC.5